MKLSSRQTVTNTPALLDMKTAMTNATRLMARASDVHSKNRADLRLRKTTLRGMIESRWSK